MSSQGALRRLTGDALVYGLGHVASQILGLIFVPVFTHYLVVADYGVLETILVLFNLLPVLVPMGLGAAVLRHVFDTDDPEEQKRFVGAGLAGTMLLAAVATPVLVVAAPAVSRGLFGTDAQTALLRVAFLAAPGASVRTFALSVLRARFRKWTYGFLSLVSVLLQGALNVLMVVVLLRGVEGIFLAGLVSLTSVGVLGVVLIRGDVRLNLSRDRLRSLLAYGAPLVPASLAFWALSSLDRMLLAVLRGQEAVGLYAVGSKVAAVAAFATFALTQAYVPLSYELATRPGQERTYGRILLAYAAGMGALAVALAAFGSEIVGVLAAPAYAGGAAVVPWLVAGVALSGAGSILATGIHLAKRTVWVTVVALAAAATNLGLNAWWIPDHGMIGAAAATLVSYALMDLLLTVAAQKLHPLPFPWVRAGALAMLAAAGIAAGTWIEPWWGRVLVVLGFAATAAVAIRWRTNE